MNDSELDSLLNAPLPERDAGEFSVTLMERITRHEARGARFLSWLTCALLVVVIAAACLFGVRVSAQETGSLIAVACTLTFLALLLSYAVLQSARD